MRSEQQRLARALGARRSLLERRRGEHVDLVRREPAGEVAAAGGRGCAAGQRQPWLGEREHRRAGVHDHGDVTGRALEHVLERRAELLEVLERRHGLVGVL
jgi:hypothetical protein